MPTRAPRRAASLRAILAGALLASIAVLPASQAVGPAACGPTPDGRWQRFGSVGMTVSHVASYPSASSLLLAASDSTVKRSSDGGCSWTTIFSAAAGQQVVDVSFIQSPRLQVLVNDTASGAARPRVFTSGDQGKTFDEANDLPVAGTARAMAGARRRTIGYVAITPAAPSTVGTTPTGGVPTVPGVVPPTGVPVADGDPGTAVFQTSDGGRTFAARAAGADLPGSISELAVDDANAAIVWAIAGGRLVVSTDFAKSFATVDGVPAGVRGLAQTADGGAVAFAGERGYVVTGQGANVTPLPAPGGVTAAAIRGADDSGGVMLAAGNHLDLWSTDTGAATDVTPAGLATATDVSGDVSGSGATFAVAAGAQVLRYVDLVLAKPKAPTKTVKVGGPAAVGRPTLSPDALTVQVGSGQRRTVPLTLRIPSSPTPVDLLFLLDHTSSMGDELKTIKTGTQKLVQDLLDDGVDLRVGLVLAGTSSLDGSSDPAVNPPDLTYQKPQIYIREADLGDPSAFFGAVANAQIETAPNGPGRQQAQLAALRQALVGDGIRDPNTAGATYLINPGQQVTFRPGAVRRVVVDITDQALEHFDAGKTPPGTPSIADIGALMKERDILHVSVLRSGTDAPYVAEHQQLTALTGALVGKGGLDCDGDGIIDVKAGQPAVCPTSERLADAVKSALRAVTDVQPVAVKAVQSDAVLTNLALTTTSVDAYLDNQLPISVTVACPVAKTTSSHPQVVAAMFRGEPVAQADLDVECGAGPPPPIQVQAPPAKAAAAVARGTTSNPPAPVQAAPAPVVPPVAPPVPAQAPAPAQAPQVNAQSVTNVQAVAEEQQQVQLALALNEGLPTEEGQEQLSMVDRRSAATDDALAVLALGALMGAGTLAAQRRRTHRTTRSLARQLVRVSNDREQH